MSNPGRHVIWLEQLGRGDVARVGGKNASLGEMVRNLGTSGVRVPPGSATTANTYWQYVEANDLRKVIADSLTALAAGHVPLSDVGATIRRGFLRGTWPQDAAKAIQTAYRELCRRARKTDVAVRSSATCASKRAANCRNCSLLAVGCVAGPSTRRLPENCSVMTQSGSSTRLRRRSAPAPLLLTLADRSLTRRRFG